MSERASDLIERELNLARKLLNDRLNDLVKIEKDFNDAEEAVDRLRSKIHDLEHDKRALDRGYVAMMGDSAGKAGNA